MAFPPGQAKIRGACVFSFFCCYCFYIWITPRGVYLMPCLMRRTNWKAPDLKQFCMSNLNKQAKRNMRYSIRIKIIHLRYRRSLARSLTLTYLINPPVHVTSFPSFERVVCHNKQKWKLKYNLVLI